MGQEQSPHGGSQLHLRILQMLQFYLWCLVLLAGSQVMLSWHKLSVGLVGDAGEWQTWDGDQHWQTQQEYLADEVDTYLNS
jgi:hypothetical protein